MNNSTIQSNEARLAPRLAVQDFDVRAALQGARTEDPPMSNAAGVFQRSEIAPRDLLRYERGQDYRSYLGQKTYGRILTPDADEASVAETLAIVCSPVLRYNADDDEWMAWNGTVWQKEPGAGDIAIKKLLHSKVHADGGTIPPLVQPCAVVQEKEQYAALQEAKDAGIAEQRDKRWYYAGTARPYVPYSPVSLQRIATQRMMSSLKKLMCTSEPLYSRRADYDRHPGILPCDGLYVDLDTDDGKVITPDPNLLLTKQVNSRVDLNADISGSEWMKFLETSLPDPELRDYLQTAVGVALHGGVHPQQLFVLTGRGANGKGVLLDVLGHVFGDLAADLPRTIIQSREGEAPSNDMAMLAGVRFALVSETRQDVKWNTASVKQLTGGDTITARELFQNYGSFRPTHTFFIASNNRPRVGAGERAFWRRYREIHFPVTFVTHGGRLQPGEVHADKTLASRLKEHPEVVLAWALQGWMRYQRHGLVEPACVMEAVEDAQESSSPFSVFAREVFTLTGEVSDAVPASAAFALWDAWRAQDTSLKHISPNTARDMEKLADELGVQYAKSNGGRNPAAIQQIVLTKAGQDLIAMAKLTAAGGKKAAMAWFKSKENS